jgi:holliday junction DNA helicase RuvA
MIALLSGTPIVHEQQLIIDVSGVGYEVQVSPQTLTACANLPKVTLQIFTSVKEQSIELYGFMSSQDKQLFLYLLSVQGIGPKTALHICQQSANQIVEAVMQADVSFFAKIPRVGKKLAQKIIIELTSKVGGLKELDLSPLNDQQHTIVEALLALGFDEELARDKTRNIDLSKLTIEQAIATVIKGM